MDELIKSESKEEGEEKQQAEEEEEVDLTLERLAILHRKAEELQQLTEDWDTNMVRLLQTRNPIDSSMSVYKTILTQTKKQCQQLLITIFTTRTKMFDTNAFSRNRESTMLMKDRVSVIVVYASQQGNAQAIAEDLHEELEEHLKNCDVSLRLECISKLGEDPSKLSKSDCAVFVAATTGDGDPPDTARKLWRVMNKSKSAGCGNSNSNDSNADPKQFDDGIKIQYEEKVSSDSSMKLGDIPPKLTDSSLKIPDYPEKVENSHETVDDSLDKVDDSPEKVDDSPEKVDDSPEKVDDTPEKADDSPERVDDSPEKVNVSLEKVNVSLENVNDSPKTVNDSPEKGSDFPDKENDFSVKVDDSLKKVAKSSLRGFDNGAHFSEPVVLSSDQLNETDKNKLGIEMLDAVVTQTTDVPRNEVGTKDTSSKDDFNKLTNVSRTSKMDFEIKERGKKPIDPKIELSHLTYTVLGLGDTNYTNFCNFGKNLDDILHQLGAQRFYSCGWADDGTGLELVIEPWKENFWPAITEHVVNLAKRKQKRASTITSEIETKISTSGLASEDLVKPQLDKSLALNDMKVATDARVDIEGKERNVVISKLKNLRLSDTDLWKLNHPLLRLEFTPETKLTLPKIPTLDTIVLEFPEETSPHELTSYYQNFALLPSARSGIHKCNVEFRHLSLSMINKPVKKVVEAVLQPASEDEFDYEPGDTIAVLAHNNHHDVELVLERLSAPPDKICRLVKNPSAKKQLPQHLPVCSSLREIFTSCVDICCIPKKALLLQFLSCCTDSHEIRCLQELVSREGSEFYLKKVLGDRITFIDFLFVFASCKLEITALLEVLPRLLPRAYSLTSSPLSKTKQLSFVYSLTVIPKSDGRFEQRKGVCTGMFDSLDDQKSKDPEATFTLSIYFRSISSFRLPKDYSKPIIMIGPGTGIAPFIGFLRHRKHQFEENMIDSTKVGESWLFCGCRFREADELFKEEIQELVASKVLTSFHRCFSREHQLQSVVRDGISDHKYVQDLLRFHSKSLLSSITENDAVVYVCGDAAKMAKDVYSTFSSILTEHFGDELEGSRYLSQMQKDKRYLQDVWT
ncbi:FAD-binding type 1 [Trinorchestia longiramus]|nr:FAD-binding type 1 [Trinorchestia longiramus]